jgi:hypothetical protein
VSEADECTGGQVDDIAARGAVPISERDYTGTGTRECITL